MTPAELLALVVLGNMVYGFLEAVIDPNAIKLTVNNPLAAAIRVVFAVGGIALALVVLL